MSELEEFVDQLNKEIDHLRQEIPGLTERQAQVRLRLKLTRQLRKELLGATSKEPKPTVFSALSEAKAREAWIAWLKEADSRLKNLLRKPGAEARLRHLLPHEPPLTYGEVIDDLERL